MSRSTACVICARRATKSARRPIAPPNRACSVRNGRGRSFTTPSIRGRCTKRPNDAAYPAQRLIVPARPDLGPPPRLAYIASPLDRVAQLRGDEAAEKRLREDARAGVYVVVGELVVLKSTGQNCDPLFSSAEAGALGAGREGVLLGLLDGAPRFGLGLDAETIEHLKSRNDLKI